MGPHFITILGAYLFRRIVAVEGGVAWVAVDTVVAIALQAAAFALIYGFLKAPGLRRGLLVAASVPAFVVVAEQIEKWIANQKSR